MYFKAIEIVPISAFLSRIHHGHLSMLGLFCSHLPHAPVKGAHFLQCPRLSSQPKGRTLSPYLQARIAAARTMPAARLTSRITPGAGLASYLSTFSHALGNVQKERHMQSSE